ncbi:hypothetical protein Z043_126305, partial [Scleropages formosus]
MEARSSRSSLRVTALERPPNVRDINAGTEAQWCETLGGRGEESLDTSSLCHTSPQQRVKCRKRSTMGVTWSRVCHLLCLSYLLLLPYLSVTSSVSLDLTELRNKVAKIKVNPRGNLWAT